MRLFRAAVLVHDDTRQYGRIVLARPVSFAWLTGLFVAIAVSIGLFLAGFSTTRKVQVGGVLLPRDGLIGVLPAQSGRVMEVRVREGQEVAEGDVLFVLGNDRTSATRGEAGVAMTELLTARRDSLVRERQWLARPAMQKHTALRLRVSELTHELRRIDAQIALLRRRVDLAGQSVARSRELLLAGFISAAGVQDAESGWIDQQARLSDLQRIRASVLRERDTVRADLDDTVIQARRDAAAVQRQADGVEQDLTENEARRRLLVRAPHTGRVSGMTAQAGQVVAAEQSLAWLLPRDSRLEAELYAPSHAAGFVRPGMVVLIRYQAYPHQKFGQFRGMVREVSHSPISGRAPLDRGEQDEPRYRIRVTLARQHVTAYGRPEALRPGMRLEASLLLERRKLHEWVLAPLYSFHGRM